MQAVNMLEAKSTLSRLVQAIEEGREKEIVIARNGRPAARLVPLENAPAERRLGVAKGRFTVPDSIDEQNAEVAALFEGAGTLKASTSKMPRTAS
jgi:antitoxin (DNA-binding transcriptional repressor) of toxin-antitoxin stability system